MRLDGRNAGPQYWALATSAPYTGVKNDFFQNVKL